MKDNYFVSLESYTNYIFNKITTLKLEVRKITDLLFIEKIEFLVENDTNKNYIFKEILNHNYELLKKVNSLMENNNLKPMHSFKYLNENDKILIYFIWKDKFSNYVKSERDFIILENGSSLTIR